MYSLQHEVSELWWIVTLLSFLIFLIIVFGEIWFRGGKR